MPDLPFQINRAHPSIAGLVSLVVGSNAGAVELIQPRAVTTAGTIVADRDGASIRDFALTASAATELDFTSGSFTVAAWVRLTAGITVNKFPTIFARRVYVSESNNQGWELAAVNGGTPAFSFRAFRNNGFASYQLNAGTPAAGLWFIAGTSNGTTRRIYVNAVELNNTNLNANPVSSAGNLANITDTDQIPILMGMAWARELSVKEISALYYENTRWSLIQPIPGLMVPFDFLAAPVPDVSTWFNIPPPPHVRRTEIIGY